MGYVPPKPPPNPKMRNNPFKDGDMVMLKHKHYFPKIETQEEKDMFIGIVDHTHGMVTEIEMLNGRTIECFADDLELIL